MKLISNLQDWRQIYKICTEEFKIPTNRFLIRLVREFEVELTKWPPGTKEVRISSGFYEQEIKSFIMSKNKLPDSFNNYLRSIVSPVEWIHMTEFCGNYSRPEWLKVSSKVRITKCLKNYLNSKSSWKITINCPDYNREIENSYWTVNENGDWTVNFYNTYIFSGVNYSTKSLIRWVKNRKLSKWSSISVEEDEKEIIKLETY